MFWVDPIDFAFAGRLDMASAPRALMSAFETPPTTRHALKFATMLAHGHLICKVDGRTMHSSSIARWSTGSSFTLTA